MALRYASASPPDPREPHFKVTPEAMPYLLALRQFLSVELRKIEEAATSSSLPAGRTYSLTNVTAQRTLDGASGTLADTREVLATVIQDLADSGKLRTKGA